MADNSFIYTYWKRQQQLFDTYFSALRKYPEENALREIRTTIKKLRATRRLYTLMTGVELSNHSFTDTEDFFTVLGCQRDVEITIENLKLFEKEGGTTHPELKSCFRSLLNISRKWTSRAVQKYKKKELMATARLLRTFLPGDAEETRKKLLDIIVSGLMDCKNYLKEPHKLRQHLKEIYYWIKMAEEYFPIRIEYTESVHKILNGLGNWRNLRVFRARIRHARKDYLSKSFKEYESIKAIEADARKGSEEYLKNALAETKRLLKKIDTGKK